MPSATRRKARPSVSEWLDLMLEEIERKKKERDEALKERARRGDDDGANSDDSRDDNQSK